MIYSLISNTNEDKNYKAEAGKVALFIYQSWYVIGKNLPCKSYKARKSRSQLRKVRGCQTELITGLVIYDIEEISDEWSTECSTTVIHVCNGKTTEHQSFLN